MEEVKPKLKVRAGWMGGARSLMVMEEQSGERDWKVDAFRKLWVFQYVC